MIKKLNIIEIEFFIIFLTVIFGLIVYFFKKKYAEKKEDWDKIEKIQNVFNNSSNFKVYFIFFLLIVIWITNKLGMNFEEELFALIILIFIITNLKIIVRLFLIK